MQRLSLFILFVFLATGVKAQQDAQYSQYMFNSLVINPAYAGYKEALNVSLLHRNQWTGFDGAPKTQSFVIDGAFFNNYKVGLGLAVVNDKAGLQGQTSAYLNYAYRLQLNDDDARLAFGLAAGVGQFIMNTDVAIIDDPGDPNFGNDKQSYFTPDAKFGVHFSNEKLYAGLSVTNLFSKTIHQQNVAENNVTRLARHYFITAGYLVDVNESIKFKPSFLIREDTKGPTNLDVNSFFLFKETLWIGASYRTGVNLWKKSDMHTGTFKQNSLVSAVELFVAKKFRAGYAYDYALSELSNYTTGTHEISFGMILNTNKKSTAMLTPRYF